MYIICNKEKLSRIYQLIVLFKAEFYLLMAQMKARVTARLTEEERENQKVHLMVPLTERLKVNWLVCRMFMYAF